VLALTRSGDRILFTVRVAPRAAAGLIAGERDGALVVRVAAPPAEGRANEAVVRIVARALDLPPSAVRLVRGTKARTKVLSVPAEAETRLAGLR
jgi:uncharacterized protein (TIGR00251 family)